MTDWCFKIGNCKEKALLTRFTYNLINSVFCTQLDEENDYYWINIVLLLRNEFGWVEESLLRVYVTISNTHIIAKWMYYMALSVFFYFFAPFIYFFF